MDIRPNYFLQWRNKTYVYLWTYRQFQQEQVEWDDVNKLLQHHGFKPVHFTDPVENKNLSDLVLLDKRSAGEIRTTLRTMLTDSERRQALIQELVKSNNQLKEEVQEHMSRAALQSQRATELEGLLEGVKTRVQDLEDRYLCKAVQHRSQTQQLQQEKQEAQKLCEVLEQKLLRQKEKEAELQRKLYFTVKEEERHLAHRSQTFQHICKRVSQDSSAADQQVLDVIDFYETEMSRLLDELRSAKGELSGPHQNQMKKTSSSITQSFQTILKAYRDQQKESKSQIEELKREAERLKQELETRPTLKEVKFYKHKLRRLEGLIKPNNTRLPKEDNATAVHEHISDRAREAGLCARYHHLLTEISTVVANASAPSCLHRHEPSSVGLELSEFRSLLPTLEVWAQQLHLLKELQRGLTKLIARLVLWQPSEGHDSADALKVEDMIMLVDTMLESTSSDDDKVSRTPTRYTLASMVSHFQKLFDVTSLSGVYPRMNQIYTRLGEMTNTMRNIREILDLDSSVPPAEVVNQVARLVSSKGQTAGFHKLLRDADIESLIVKVKQHEEFFPAFHGLIMDMFQILGVSTLDNILPALKSLKQTAQ
ncbi:centrosomal protein of 70 kDa isoform X2 [Toxotes jaculatrix]|uniref:centrosomal protein of 70 kDa isoform X2 n=1 Tax=Toxotes jaculatrix TaxID=941984 RepID=UPI001B3AD0A8|nr:centrosomal protein of 70 kDa isoform X2 [Toxotes jaculatrix]